jgi:tetratricopeptide (TPR) repeat protein
MDQKDALALRRLLEEGDRASGVAFAELDLARLQAFLFLNEQKQAGITARQIDERHGAYWKRRVGQVLAESLPSNARVNVVELLSRRADALASSGKLDQSLADYDRAAELARQAKDDDAAFELAYKAALALVRLKRPADAVGRLRASSTAMPQHSQAARAHLLAAWHAKGTADEEAILREHLATWPAGDSAAQAHLWLAQLAESSGKWQEALDHYAAVAGASPFYGEANARLAELAKEHPENGPVQEALAASLLESVDPQLLRASLARWQVIAGRTQPGQPRWLRAQYSSAMAHFKLGDKRAAAKALREVLDQPGGVRDAVWKEKYAALLKRCEA